MKTIIMEELQKDLTLKRNGKDVALKIVGVDYEMSNDRIYIKKIEVCDKIKGFTCRYLKYKDFYEADWLKDPWPWENESEARK